MSTRAIIARTVNESGTQWEGRYHHFDGYPSGLGKRLHAVAQQIGISRMLALLVDQHPGGWSTILQCDITKTPGYRGFTGEYDALTPEARYAEDMAHGPQCYCHGSRRQGGQLFLSHGDAQDTEWAYAIAEASGVMIVYKQIDGRAHGQQWERIADVDLLSADEPDWLLIECRARLANGLPALRMLLRKTVGCYAVDQWERDWATFEIINGSVVCALCGATITRGWTRALSDEHVCSAHVGYRDY